ncbi:sugar ABC transporter permease [Faecalicatena contorta]|uniref:carbohydrate ABC transporter permease n=1 Tax=Faecalicatena contorta TaxID=39482 RepID=UPI00129E4477|nr:sugar ABC transporter permease [Faecalicatena contorta]MRM89897.1 sugar ABC transporter permease [Faecalicatena contorta]
MKNKNKYLLFSLPSFLLIFAIMLFPVAYAVLYSFTDYRLGRTWSFVGLSNYISILQDSEFLSALGFTLILTVIGVICQFIFGMVLALLLDNIHHFKKPISIMIYIPYFITAAAMGVIFRWMFMSNWGMVDQLLRAVGVTAPAWLDSTFWSKVVVILGEVFQNTPFAVIILYAGLQSIPADQLEAAKIDGANAWQLFRKIKLPNLRQLIIIILMMRTMDAFRLFDRVNVTTGGGPGISTETLAIYNYTTTFTKLRIGKGCAVGVITLILLTLIVTLIMKVLRVKEVD